MVIEKSNFLFSIEELNGKYLAIRDIEPMFCLEADSIAEASDKASKALRYYNENPPA